MFNTDIIMLTNIVKFKTYSFDSKEISHLAFFHIFFLQKLKCTKKLQKKMPRVCNTRQKVFRKIIL